MNNLILENSNELIFLQKKKKKNNDIVIKMINKIITLEFN